MAEDGGGRISDSIPVDEDDASSVLPRVVFTSSCTLGTGLSCHPLLRRR